MKKRQEETRLRQIYFYALVGVVAAVVLLSGILQVARTEREFLRMYRHAAKTLTDGLAQMVRQALTLLQFSEAGGDATMALDDILLDYLSSLTESVDRRLGARAGAEIDSGDHAVKLSLSTTEETSSGPGGNGLLGKLLRKMEEKSEEILVYRVAPTANKPGRLLFVLRRRFGPGYLVAEVEDQFRQALLRRLLLQEAVEIMGGRSEVLALAIYDLEGELIASLVNDDAYPPDAVNIPWELLRGGGEAAELGHHLGVPCFDYMRGIFANERPVAVVVLRTSVASMEELKRKGRLTTLVLSVLLLGGGFVVVRVIFQHQEKTLRQLHRLEAEMRRREELSNLGEIAAGIAHEIRNPLNAISMGLQSMAISAPADAKAAKLLTTMRQELGRIDRIVANFLALQRPAQLQLQAVDPVDIVHHVADVLRQHGSGKDVSVSVEISGERRSVRADRDKLVQALLNLGINGIEACGFGGELRLVLEMGQDEVNILVSDNGTGIPADLQGEVFRPNFTTKEKGLGLGLFLAHRIVEAHGGSIELHSELGRGTTMAVRLPPVS